MYLGLVTDTLTTDLTNGLSEFHVLPIYRCYLREATASLPTDLPLPTSLKLVRDGAHPRDRKAVAAYAADIKLGYLAREDTVLLGKLTRRGLPVVARLVGYQPDEPDNRRFSVEVALLYPPSPVTDPQIERSERDRYDGLARVAAKPTHTLRPSADPLSMAHVYRDYYFEADEDLAARGWT